MPDSVRNVRVDGMYAFFSVIVCVFPFLCRFHILFLLPPLLFLFPFRGPSLFCLFFFRYAHVGHVDLCHDSTMFTCHIVYYFRAFFLYVRPDLFLSPPISFSSGTDYLGLWIENMNADV